ncbi:MAG TPA: hypothetical protein VLX90_18425 [Steroidobacteraceae bacterium]|nr:hypothetical protein [Steroidobacteraceae bacterium]
MRILILTAVFLLSGAVHAQEFKPYPRSKVTPAQWERYFEEVKSGHAESLHDLAAARLTVFTDEQTSTIYAFTQPGHPAHPAWVASRLVREGEGVGVRQIGYYAGDRSAFETLFRRYIEVNDKLKRATGLAQSGKP